MEENDQGLIKFTERALRESLYEAFVAGRDIAHRVKLGQSVPEAFDQWYLEYLKEH